MLRHALPLLAAAAFARAGTVDVTVADCCDAACKGTIKTLNNPGTCPTPGDCKAGGAGTLDVAVTDAKMELILKLSGAKILDKTTDACGPMTVNLPLGLGSVAITALAGCPAPVGPISVAIDITNKIAIPGKITSHSVTKDQDGATLLCLDLTFTPQSTAPSVLSSVGRNLAASLRSPSDNSVCFKDLCDDTCILTNRKLDFPSTTNATHGMHSVVSGTLSKDLTAPTYEMTATFMGVAVPITPGSGSACAPVVLDVSGLSTVTIDFSNGGAQSCPMAAGSTSVTPTDVTSSEDPPMGKFLTTITVKNGDGTLISSLQTQVGGC